MNFLTAVENLTLLKLISNNLDDSEYNYDYGKINITSLGKATLKV